MNRSLKTVAVPAVEPHALDTDATKKALAVKHCFDLGLANGKIDVRGIG